jgi:hypothetical protein
MNFHALDKPGVDLGNELKKIKFLNWFSQKEKRNMGQLSCRFGSIEGFQVAQTSF